MTQHQQKDKLRAIMEDNLNIDPTQKPIVEKYVDVRKLVLVEKPPTNTKIDILNQETITAAYALMDEKLNPMILNFASDKRPGGGCFNGSLAQEESLFYRSLYHLALPNNMYPLKDWDAIYSKNVEFIRDVDFNRIEPRIISCLAIAAVKNPVVLDLYPPIYSQQDEQLMIAKIESVFKIAAEHKHDSLVVGAFGCGVYNNPSILVAKMFLNAIKKYGGHFKKIVFAILDTKGHTIKIFKNVIQA
jgi:uncharacterized protein (TIGR02452 family)